jgi:CO dehydrogenase maturation factor
MKIAVAGKGGSGKTTIAGTLARVLSRRGLKDLLAIDADSNPNLALVLGMPRDATAPFIPREILARITDSSGKTKSVLVRSPDEIVRDYGMATPDGVTLLLMGRVEHAGAG